MLYIRKKGLLPLAVLFLLSILMWTQAGCEPEELALSVNAPASNSASDNKANTSLRALSVIEFIRNGEFAAAAETLKEAPKGSNGDINDLQGILENWQVLEQRREELRRKAWEGQQEKLAEQRDKIQDFSAADVNDIDITLATAIRLHELAEEEHKQQILSDPFVQKAVEESIERAKEFEKNGQWTDAYIHSYYWLTSLFENNKEYKEQAERLTTLYSIEMSLKDGTCDDTVRQRYENIKPEMLYRTLQLLENHYVTPPNYGEMITEGLKRCIYLTDVLSASREELAFKVSQSQIDLYLRGLTILAEELKKADELEAGHLISLFEEVLLLNERTLGLPKEFMIAHFSESVLKALDPFTELVWPWYVQDFERSLTQQFSGIGVEISKATGVLTIVSLLPDTPAYKSGLDADDEILAVNGEETEKMTIFCAVSKITGKKGTRVTLTIRRPATGEVKDYSIVRDRIVVQPIRGWQRTANGDWDYWLDKQNRIGYVRLTAFTETSQGDLDRILTQLEEDGLKSLVLDLRYNSGGYLDSAAEVADLFVDDGIIVKRNPRQGFPIYEYARKKDSHPYYPLVLLINGGSASASEIVAGALQDPHYNRAVLVGTRSYGKGSVQAVTPHSGGGSQLKYTMAYYHLPSDQVVKNRYQMEKQGRTDWGIAPDVEVEMYTHEVRRMLDIQRENDILVQTNSPNGSNHSQRFDLKQTLLSDPQLSAALFVAQAELIKEGKSIQQLNSDFWQMPIDPNEIK